LVKILLKYKINKCWPPAWYSALPTLSRLCKCTVILMLTF